MKDRFKNFTVLIAKINRNIRKIKTEEMAEFHLKSPHVSCLHYLYNENSLTAKELCDICEEDKGAISRSLVYLEREGYIICKDSLVKRYKSPITLTEKGKEVGARISYRIDYVLGAAGSGVSEEERRIFYKCLNIISDNLQGICDDYRDTKYCDSVKKEN